jgi:hypothetical protein
MSDTELLEKLTDTELLEKLIEAIGALARPAVPIDIAFWDIDMVAAYLCREAQHVRTRVACLPGFPEVIRLPSSGAGRSHPLYRASEVQAWAESMREPRAVKVSDRGEDDE